MAERPILFNGDMVRAILAGQKTVTRRPFVLGERDIRGRQYDDPEGVDAFVRGFNDGDWWEPLRCPAGTAGDLLYVRETFTFRGNDDHHPVRADGSLSPYPHHDAAIAYRATDDVYGPDGNSGPWRPSIHMPKWAARIWLRVTAVRVERLRSITNKQAMAEGFEGWYAPAYVGLYDVVGPDAVEPVEDYREAWGDMYGKQDGLSWEANPWVWVIEFERHYR